MNHYLARLCCGAALSCLLVQAAFAQNATPPVATPAPSAAAVAATPAKTVPTVKPGSVFVRCDGNPPTYTAGEAAVDIALITVTGGLSALFKTPEAPNVDKRLEGAAGIEACDAALAAAPASDNIRRVQLNLAKGIHRMEAGDPQGAIGDFRQTQTLAGPRASEKGFQRSLALSAMQLEALALVQQGRYAEAEQMGLQMAEVAPYDLLSQMQAARFMRLTSEMTPRKAAFLDRLVRLWPEGLLIRGDAREAAGDFSGAAADAIGFEDVRAAFWPEGKPLAALLAMNAADLALAGDIPGSQAAAARARARVEERIAAGDSADETARAQEYLDFQAVALQAARGQLAEARAAFTARSRWIAPSAGQVAALNARLRQSATAGDLKGPLAQTPAEVLAEGIKAEAARMTEGDAAKKGRYSAVKIFFPAANYTVLARGVWKTDKSRFLFQPAAKTKLKGEGIYFPATEARVPVGEAVLLHLALMAKQRGKTTFILFPGRKRVETTAVQFGNPGDPGYPTATALDADTVIAALSQDIPQPAKP